MSHFYENYTTDTKGFWENCDETFAHLEINKWLNNYGDLTVYWNDSFISRMNFGGKSVVDYGIGGGYLGKYLLSQHGISKYTGVDISERSIAKAQANLVENRDKVAFLISEDDWSTTPADIFVSQACIQHFPSVAYFQAFLDKLDKSAFNELMLQIRYSPNTFSVPDRPVLGLLTNFDYIAEKLPGFELEYTSPVEDNGYQFGIFKRQGTVSKREIEQIPAGYYEIAYFEANGRVKNLEKKLAVFQPVLKAWELLKKLVQKTRGSGERSS